MTRINEILDTLLSTPVMLDDINIKSVSIKDLIIKHFEALENEDFKVCGKIQNEVDRRILLNLINLNELNSFEIYDSELDKYFKPTKAKALNGLLDNINKLECNT